MSGVAKPVLDWTIRVDAIGKAPERLHFAAPASALAALAKAIGVDRVLSCSAALTIESEGDGADVEGEARATVIQTCSVSLEPFETTIVEPIDVRFEPAEEAAAFEARARAQAKDEEDAHAMIEGAPEPIVGGVVDLGALVQEFLALGVDPWPRKPGVEFEGAGDGDERVSPFAALARLTKPGQPEDA